MRSFFSQHNRALQLPASRQRSYYLQLLITNLISVHKNTWWVFLSCVRLKRKRQKPRLNYLSDDSIGVSHWNRSCFWMGNFLPSKEMLVTSTCARSRLTQLTELLQSLGQLCNLHFGKPGNILKICSQKRTLIFQRRERAEINSWLYVFLCFRKHFTQKLFVWTVDEFLCDLSGAKLKVSSAALMLLCAFN